MEMESKEFETTQGLLNDVMRKQAGSIEKAILEAVMNSTDAGASKVTIQITERTLQVIDDGEGMEEEDIDQYWQKFGKKDDDIEDKEFGKFRMGRGQIFNFGRNFWYTLDNVLIVDLDNDEAEVEMFEESFTVDTSGLGYAVGKIPEEAPEKDGCRISVQLYERIEDVQDTVEEVKRLIEYIPWLHDVNVTINGESAGEKFDYEFDTDLAYYKVGRSGFSTNTLIYNKGAFVKETSLNSTGGVIVTKKDLDVNFARNDILEKDGYYQDVLEEFNEFTFGVLVDDTELTASERRWLLSEATGDPNRVQAIKDKPLIQTVARHMVAPEDLDGEVISYGAAGDTMAKQAMEEQDVTILDESDQTPVEEFMDEHYEAQQEALADVMESKSKWEMEAWDYNELGKRRQKNFDRAVWFLQEVGYMGDVQPGYSERFDVWKDEEGVLFIDKVFLKMNKTEFLTEGLQTILVGAAQSGDSRDGLKYGFSFKSSYWDLAEDMGEAQRQLINGDAP